MVMMMVRRRTWVCWSLRISYIRWFFDSIMLLVIMMIIAVVVEVVIIMMAMLGPHNAMMG